jgi:hypothetical protein
MRVSDSPGTLVYSRLQRDLCADKAKVLPEEAEGNYEIEASFASIMDWLLRQ